VTDDTERPSEHPDQDADVALAKVMPFSRTRTAKARKAVRSLGFRQ